AVSIMESVRTLAQTNRHISEMEDVAMLLTCYQNDVHALIAKGISLRREVLVHFYDVQLKSNFGALDSRNESKHVQFVREFATTVSVLQNKAEALTSINVSVQRALKDLETCPYSGSAFQERLDTIQTQVDQLNLQNYVNL